MRWRFHLLPKVLNICPSAVDRSGVRRGRFRNFKYARRDGAQNSRKTNIRKVTENIFIHEINRSKITFYFRKTFRFEIRTAAMMAAYALC